MVCTVAPGTSADYCIQEQAEYHLGGREPNGRWYSSGQFAELRDGADVDNVTFRNLHEGLTPDGQEQIGKPNAQGERVAGYDIQFGAPKSVSVLWALADPETRAKIESIHHRAVRAALDFGQQVGAQIRTGHNGVNIEKTKMFGATFQHGESRPTEREDGARRSDPQLHAHTIIFNLGQGADGKWRAIDGRPLMSLQKAMGAQYHAELAHLFETELGARIQRHDLAEERHNGEFEIEGVAPELIEQFSTRREQIEEEMAKHGLETRDAQRLADEIALATRQGKSDETREQQFERWTKEAGEAGHTWSNLAEQCLGRHLDQAAEQERTAAYEDSLQRVTERLTEHESVFSQADLYAAVAAAGAGRGVGAVDVQAHEAKLLAEAGLVKLAEDEKGMPIYSTPEMVGIERQMRDWARAQATAYPNTEQEKSDERCHTPSVKEDFGLPGDPYQLDADQDADGSFAQSIDGLPGLSSVPLARDFDRAEMFLPGDARDNLDVYQSAPGAHNLRRAGDASRTAPHTISADVIELYICERADGDKPFTVEQTGAVHWIGACGGSHVVVEGGAGTGKTIAIQQSAADLYHAMGYKVLATAQRWVTSLELAKIKTPDGKRIEGRAAAKWIADYQAGKAKFDSKTVLLVDEAGQMGSKEMHALMQIANATGCRIVWTGDRKQQKAVAAGDPMAILAKELGSYRLAESQRMQPTAADVLAWRDGLGGVEAHRRALTLTKEQKADLVAKHGKAVHEAGAVWARAAADDFANGRAADALRAFQEHDQFVWSDTHAESLAAAVRDWAEFKAENPNATALVSAARHMDLRELNSQMRDHLRSLGQIGEDKAVVAAVAANGDKYEMPVAIGDQVRLGANLKDLNLYNGMVGIVRGISAGSQPGHPSLVLDMDTPAGVRRIEIETQRLADEDGRARLSHAYAATNILIQGATVDAEFGQVRPGDRANTVYVIASRARHLTKLYDARDDVDVVFKRTLNLSERPGARFDDRQREEFLGKAFSRGQVKKSTLDYEAAVTPPAETIQAAAAGLSAVRQKSQQQEANPMATKTVRKNQASGRDKQAADVAAAAQRYAKEESISQTYDDELARDEVGRARQGLDNAVREALRSGLTVAQIEAAARQGVSALDESYNADAFGTLAVVRTVAEGGASHQQSAEQTAAGPDSELAAAVQATRERVEGGKPEPVLEKVERWAARYTQEEGSLFAAGDAENALSHVNGSKTQLAAAVRDAVNAGKSADEIEAAAEKGGKQAFVGGQGWWGAAKVARDAMGQTRRFAEEMRRRQAEHKAEETAFVGAAGRTAGKAASESPPSRPQARDANTPDAQLEKFFGHRFADNLTRDITQVAVHSNDSISVQFSDRAELHHHSDSTTLFHGRMTEERAALMAEMMLAEGHSTVEVNGSLQAKEMMAKACLERGLRIANPELTAFCERFYQQQEQARQAKAGAGMKAAAGQEQQTRPQNPQASSPAMRMIEAGRIARDIAVVTNAVERFVLADRLVELTAGEASGGKYAFALTERNASAAAIINDPSLSQQAQQTGVFEKVGQVHMDHLAASNTEFQATAQSSSASHEAEAEA